ncbi:MAG: NAD(P)-binding domain-containing protein [Pseudomonadota bacterium]
MSSFEWTVVGAGPAGLAAVGKLIDRGVKPSSIAWVDTEFQVGDLGQKWYRVSSNTQVKLFTQFLEDCDAFRFELAPDFKIRHHDPEANCLLNDIAEPLRWITQQFAATVQTFKGQVSSLVLKNQCWEVELGEERFLSRNVVLAIGSEPKGLDYPNLEEIPVDLALNDEKMLEQSLKGDTVAVFGSSHSSMIVLQNLLKTDAKRILNFYLHPLKYSLYLNEGMLYPNTGLRGAAAVWAREAIDGTWPDRLERYHCTDPAFDKLLASCEKVVYTIGFQPRTPPLAPQFPELNYNDCNGIIAPGLFGLGIAYPQRVVDPFGNVEHNVGLWKFMNYLNSIMDLWMKYSP